MSYNEELLLSLPLGCVVPRWAAAIIHPQRQQAVALDRRLRQVNQ